MKIPNGSMFRAEIYVHNLMINPDDVPNDGHRVFNESGYRVYLICGEWYIESDYFDESECVTSTPKLWYDIPEFDVDRTELENMTKEELIELILEQRGEK